MRIAILSDGGWGTALALMLLRQRHQVCLWGPFPDYVEEMRRTRRNDRFLKGSRLPPELGLTAAMGEAVAGAAIVVLAAPTPYMRAALVKLRAAGVPAGAVLVNVAKGIEEDSLKRISQIVADELGEVAYATLSGPSHAEEVLLEAPTAVVVASRSGDAARLVQREFMYERFRVYSSDDVVGVELGGALKNVFAIAAGIADGMKLGDNAKAALITRGIAELARLGHALGGRPETFSGLSGLGDMIVTCGSQHSRNRYVGEQLGKGLPLDAIVQSMGKVVAEGVKTTRGAHALARRAGVATPIIEQVHAALYEGRDPRHALDELMTRDARPERD